MRSLGLILLLAIIAVSSSCQTSQPYTPPWEAGNQRQPAPRRVPTRPQPRKTFNTNRLVPSKPLAKPRTVAPQPTCAAVCVIDPRTGNVLYAHNAHVRRQVASTQKIITALCICDIGNLNKWVTISEEDTKAPPIKLGLKPGTRYRRSELLRAMLTGSYNDVALTLARDAAGSVEAFVERMNKRAQRMQMYNTHFENPNGLPAQQYSTAYDMALAACYAYNNPIIRSYINVPEYTFTLADGKTRKIESTNKLLKKHSWVQGMKTGYTNLAGKCLISCGSVRGQGVIVVVLGSTNDKIWNESLKYLRWALNLSDKA